MKLRDPDRTGIEIVGLMVIGWLLTIGVMLFLAWLTLGHL